MRFSCTVLVTLSFFYDSICAIPDFVRQSQYDEVEQGNLNEQQRPTPRKPRYHLSNQEKYGIPFDFPEEKIRSSDESEGVSEEYSDDQYIFVALIDIVFVDGCRRTCTGAIIHDNVVITAAHCFTMTKDKFIQPELSLSYVVVGTKLMFDTGYEQYLPIERVVTHPRFNKGWTADLALVYTFANMYSDRPAEILPLMMEKAAAPVDTNVTVLSWGKCLADAKPGSDEEEIKVDRRDVLREGKNKDDTKSERIRIKEGKNKDDTKVEQIHIKEKQSQVDSERGGKNKDDTKGERIRIKEKQSQVDSERVQKKITNDEYEVTRPSNDDVYPNNSKIKPDYYEEMNAEENRDTTKKPINLPQADFDEENEGREPSDVKFNNRSEFDQRSKSSFQQDNQEYQSQILQKSHQKSKNSKIRLKSKNKYLLRPAPNEDVLRRQINNKMEPSRQPGPIQTYFPLPDYDDATYVNRPKKQTDEYVMAQIKRNAVKIKNTHQEGFNIQSRRSFPRNAMPAYGRDDNVHELINKHGYRINTDKRNKGKGNFDPKTLKINRRHLPSSKNLRRFNKYKNWRRSISNTHNNLTIGLFGYVNLAACKKIVEKSLPPIYELQSVHEYLCYSSEDFYITNEDSGAPVVQNHELVAVTLGGLENEGEHVAIGLKLSCFCSWIAHNLPNQDGLRIKCCTDCCNDKYTSNYYNRHHQPIPVGPIIYKGKSLRSRHVKEIPDDGISSESASTEIEK